MRVLSSICLIVVLCSCATPGWAEETKAQSAKEPTPAGRIRSVPAPSEEKAKLASKVAKQLEGIAEGVSVHALGSKIVVVFRADVHDTLDDGIVNLVAALWASAEPDKPQPIQSNDHNEIIFVRHLNAGDIVKQLKKKSFDLNIEALGDDRIVVGWISAPLKETNGDSKQEVQTAGGTSLIPAATRNIPADSKNDVESQKLDAGKRIKLLRDKIAELDRPLVSKEGVESSVVRVYYTDAAKVAEALDEKVGGLTVKAVGSDQVVISGADPAEEADVSELARRIALLDMPRPKVGLQVWSLQLSSGKPEQVQADATVFRSAARDLDDEIRQAFDNGWNYIVEITREHLQAESGNESRPLETHLFRYLTRDIQKPCADDVGYCLGYRVAENAYPSMSKMIFVLAAAENPQDKAAKMIDEMETDDGKPEWNERLRFHSFRKALQSLLSKTAAPRLRAAMADFLFNYKWSVQYPHDFGDYSLARSAENLNALFDPVFEAYNRDVGDYVQHQLALKLRDAGAGKRFSGLTDRGYVTVEAVGGEAVAVEAASASYFDVTVPPNPAALIGAAGTKGIDLIAKLSEREPTVVEVRRGIKASFTPSTLPTGAGMEVHVKLETGEGDAAPTQVGGSDPNKHALDRVAKHLVDTKIRIAPLRLFEVSTFSQQVYHPQLPGTVPVIGQVWDYAFGGVPGLNGMFKWRRKPIPMAHRSIMLVNATVVPTAMDLGLGIRFGYDRNGDGARYTTADQDWRTWHYMVHRCLISSRSEDEMRACIERSPKPPGHPASEGAKTKEAAKLASR